MSLSFNNTLPNNGLTKGITKDKWMDGNGVFFSSGKRERNWECGRVDLRKCLEKHRNSENWNRLSGTRIQEISSNPSLSAPLQRGPRARFTLKSSLLKAKSTSFAFSDCFFPVFSSNFCLYFSSVNPTFPRKRLNNNPH